MATIKLAEVFSITQVSSDNIKVWPTLAKMMEDIPKTEKVIIDAERVNLESPWLNIEFSKMLSRGNIHLIVYHSEEVCKNIKMLLNALTGKNNSVENLGTVFEEKPVSEKDNKVTVKKFRSVSYIVGEYGVIQIGKAFSTMSMPYMIEDLMYVINGMIPPKDFAKNITLDFEGVGAISKGLFEILHRGLKELVMKGIKLNIQNVGSADSEQLEILSALESGMQKGLGETEKMNILKRRLPMQTVGMLCKYENSRKTDECGRKGGGKILWSRISIFKGFAKDTGGITVAKFFTYHRDKFCTQIHKMMEFMEDEHEASVLEKTIVSVPLHELGFWDSFFGSTYHFNFMVQYKPDQSRTMWCVDSDGNRAHKSLTLPELAMVVLDDYGEQYNRRNLEEYIQETKIELSKYNEA